MERVRETLEARQVWIYFAAMAVGAVLGVLIPSLDSLEAAMRVCKILCKRTIPRGREPACP